MDAMERLYSAGIVPVVVIDRAEDAVPTAQALLRGGIDVMEITFRTAAAADAITAIHDTCPDMLVGAGTVTTLEQCRQAARCGAGFIVSPGFCRETVGWCMENRMAVIPGCVTPTEIQAAMACGLQTLKFFPAHIFGGLAAMKALSGPFPTVKFIPTGGVKQETLEEYLRAPFVHAVGGSWVCSREDIAAGHFEKITALCTEAHHAVQRCRPVAAEKE